MLKPYSHNFSFALFSFTNSECPYVWYFFSSQGDVNSSAILLTHFFYKVCLSYKKFNFKQNFFLFFFVCDHLVLGYRPSKLTNLFFLNDWASERHEVYKINQKIFITKTCPRTFLFQVSYLDSKVYKKKRFKNTLNIYIKLEKLTQRFWFPIADGGKITSPSGKHVQMLRLAHSLSTWLFYFKDYYEDLWRH